MSSFFGIRGILVSFFILLGYYYYIWVGYFLVVIDVFFMFINYIYCIYLLCSWWFMIVNFMLFFILDDYCDLD